MKRSLMRFALVVFLLVPTASYAIGASDGTGSGKDWAHVHDANTAIPDAPAAPVATPTPPPATITQVMSAEDAVALRQQLAALAKAMDVKVDPPKSAKDEATEQQNHKTAADVADRALTMVSGLVAQLAQSMEKIAPQLWRIMIRQQYSKAAGNLVFPWLGFICVLIYWLFARKRVPKMIANWDKKEKGDLDGSGEPKLDTLGWIFAQAVPLVLMFILAWIGCSRLADSIQLLINPEYYAVKDILQMLLKPDAM